ncbi:hypothetical protein HK097_003703 [Rhizophlyctis rosea]|uniref:Arabinogalactan endo-beta-1,4-galactanase n=1 Tax=Rhizophlyctis rosea TaxID=64517 RepID=A0AAD5X4Y4_9FUNG|nr:hypothetical protein HK097_003703 [Rhizophlyctis rosea]
MDAVRILKNGGSNYVRLRVWTAGEYTVDNAIALAKRAKALGMGILLDPHYSDTWADPAHQSIPNSWPTNLSGLNTQIYTYTKNLVSAFASARVPVDIIQIGNEIRTGLLWPVGKAPAWSAISQLLNSGANGAKDGNPSSPPKIMVHLDNGWNWSQQQYFWDNVQVQGALTLDKVDYMGVSYYPFYDTAATLSSFRTSLTNMANRYKRPIVVAETNWPASTCTKAVSETSIPLTAAGQTQWIREVAKVVCGLPNGLGKGIFYWEPTWVTK